MSKLYAVSFQLFDVTKGERLGDILDQSAPETIEGLKGYEEKWRAYCAESPVDVPPPQQKATRVALSRNGGAAIMRARFEHEGSKYLVQMRVEKVADIWRGEINGAPVLIEAGEAVTLTVGGVSVELVKVSG